MVCAVLCDEVPTTAKGRGGEGSPDPAACTVRPCWLTSSCFGFLPHFFWLLADSRKLVKPLCSRAPYGHDQTREIFSLFEFCQFLSLFPDLRWPQVEPKPISTGHKSAKSRLGTRRKSTCGRLAAAASRIKKN